MENQIAQSANNEEKKECTASPNGKHWFTQHVGDQNPSTFSLSIGACVFCKRVDLENLPNL